MSEEKFYELERLHDKIYEETQEYGRTQFVSRIADLQQENLQLKEELSEWKINYSILQNKVIECNEDRIRLNNVLDEIREYIKDTCYYPELENYSNMTSDEVLELMNILDKAIE